MSVNIHYYRMEQSKAGTMPHGPRLQCRLLIVFYRRRRRCANSRGATRDDTRSRSTTRRRLTGSRSRLVTPAISAQPRRPRPSAVIRCVRVCTCVRRDAKHKRQLS